MIIHSWTLFYAWVWKPVDLGHGIQSCGYHGPYFAHSSRSVHVHGSHAISGESGFVIDGDKQNHICSWMLDASWSNTENIQQPYGFALNSPGIYDNAVEVRAYK